RVLMLSACITQGMQAVRFALLYLVVGAKSYRVKIACLHCGTAPGRQQQLFSLTRLALRGLNRYGATFDFAKARVHAVGTLNLCCRGERADVNAGVTELVGQNIGDERCGIAYQ